MIEFVSHIQNQNQISSYHASMSMPIIVIVIFLLILLSIRGKQNDCSRNKYFSIETTCTLRGIAVILLILGHLSVKCIEGLMPFELAGEWAVIMFLLISGVALTKRYGLRNCMNNFVKKRLKRLLFPVWITLILFYLLDYLLLGQTHSPVKIVFSFLGIIGTGPPNGPAWFISYIISLYIIYYISSLQRIKVFNKFLTILFLSYIMTYSILYVPLLERYFSIWKQYAAVFPLAVLLGLYDNKIYSFLSAFYRSSTILFYIVMIGFAFAYIKIGNDRATEVSYISLGLRIFIESLYPVCFIVFVAMLAYMLDIARIKSRVLLFLGEYSFEIYLLHLPFMEYYDFLLFRKPLFLYFFIYVFVVLILSYQLRRLQVLLLRIVPIMS